MKKHLLLLLAIVLLGSTAHAGVVVVQGKYQLRNLFVLNGKSPTGVGYCVFEVTVNEDISPDEVNSDAFEVDLSQYGFEMGDEIEVKIKYKDGCEPKVLNPEALEPIPTFEVSNIQVSASGLLQWETVNEQGQLPFIVQQFKWNKWVNLGEVQGVGTSNTNSYQFQSVPVSGTNKMRVIQKSFGGKLRSSQAVTFESSSSPVTFEYQKKKARLQFTRETAFEIYNKYGQITIKGFGNEVNVENLKKGTYYLTFDSNIEEFTKR